MRDVAGRIVRAVLKDRRGESAMDYAATATDLVLLTIADASTMGQRASTLLLNALNTAL